MSLPYKPSWIKAAKAGARKPVLLFDFRPVVAYDEANHRGDWKDAIKSSNADLDHDSDELRLARLAENSTPIFSPEKQINQSGHLDDTFWSFVYHPIAGLAGPGFALSDFIQICKFDWGFKIKKLYIGLYNRNNEYKGYTNIRLLSGVQKRNPVSAASWGDTQDAIGQAEEIFSFKIDHNLDGHRANEAEYEKVSYISDSESKRWCVINLEDQNVWMPGGIPCAIVIGAESILNPQEIISSFKAQGTAVGLTLLGSDSRDSYSNGDCLKSARACKVFKAIDGDMSFKFEIDGYESSGYVKLGFDMGSDGKVKENRFGELELRYADPAGTRLMFRKRESADNSSWGTWGIVSDGSKITQRYVQVWIVMNSTTYQYDTPRVYSVRCTIKDSQKFIMAKESLFGYPSVGASPPDYSSEGDPLSGTAKNVDRSSIELIDSGGMISNFLNLYHFKNCEVVVKLGFDNTEFTEDDYLAFKTLWVEDWEVLAGKVVFHCYDQQVKFREAEAPILIDPPNLTEEIHYSAQTPAAIKRDLLKRARIRPSRINGASFTALEDDFSWSLTYAIRKPTGLRKVDEALNQHLLAFMTVDERGRWSVRYVNFDASAAASFSGNDLLLRSEKFLPGRKALRNVVTVLFGGTDTDDTTYRGIAIDFDEDSRKQNVESAYDKLYSEFIPLTEDANDESGIPMTVAHRRLNLQKEGLRVIEWASPIEFAYLQIGDHVNVTSTLYQRTGATTPNPLLVMITRKSIDRSLGQINWTGIVLFDGDESIDGSAPMVEAPTNFAITAGGDGTVDWSWDASADDTGATNQHYRLYQRPAHSDDWGAYKASVTATGAGSYTYPGDTEFSEIIRYDFGVRFVASNGRMSAIVAVDNTLLTDSTLDALENQDWGMLELPGAVEIFIINEITGAIHYNVYAKHSDASGWYLADTIPANADRKHSLVWTPPNPYSWTSERWIQFKIAAVDHWGAESTHSPARTFCYFPLLASTDTLSAPALADDESYPEISRKAVGPYQAFSIKHKITAAAGEQDMVGHYELQRRNDEGSGKVSWSGWQILTPDMVKQVISSTPAPNVLYYDNTDRTLKPGYYYQYQVRAVGRNSKAGTWSSTVEIQLTDDTTAPAQPTVSVVALPLGNLLTIVGGTEADFAYFKIEGSDDAGESWSTLVEKQVLTVWIHGITTAGIDVTWRYRVTAYDHSGNASDVSEESTDYGATKIVTDVVVANTFVAGDMAFTVAGTTNIIGLINASSEGGGTLNIAANKIAVIAGAGLHITGDTTFSADVEIQGILKSGGGIKTSAGDDRIELGSFEGTHSIRQYNAGDLYIEIVAGGINAYDGSDNVRAQMTGVSGYPGFATFGGYGINCSGDLRVNGVYKMDATTIIDASRNLTNMGTAYFAGAINTIGGYKFNTLQVVGARQAHIPDASDVSAISIPAGDDTVNISTFNTALTGLKNEINAINAVLKALLASDETHGLRASS